jgi:hypothetical protein
MIANFGALWNVYGDNKFEKYKHRFAIMLQ